MIVLMNRWLKNCKFWVISSSRRACDASNESKTEIAYTSVRLIEIQRLPLVVNIIVTVVAENKEERVYYSPYSNFSSERWNVISFRSILHLRSRKKKKTNFNRFSKKYRQRSRIKRDAFWWKFLIEKKLFEGKIVILIPIVSIWHRAWRSWLKWNSANDANSRNAGRLADGHQAWLICMRTCVFLLMRVARFPC